MNLSIYIGKNMVSYETLKVAVGENLICFSNVTAAEVYLSQYQGDGWVVVFYEKGNVSKDCLYLTSLKAFHVKTVAILVANMLDPIERIDYIKAGVCHAVSQSADVDLINKSIEDVIRTRTMMQKASQLNTNQDLTPFTISWPKRVFDILISVTALLLLSPLLLLIVLAIRIESRGPIVYKSKRVGTNFRVFDFLKFRSMYADADKRMKEFMSANMYGSSDHAATQASSDVPLELPSIKGEYYFVDDDLIFSEQEYYKQRGVKQEKTFVKILNDPRVTKVGAFLRKFSLDELPQLINVIKGEMSIIGNRPLPLYEADQLTDDQNAARFIAAAGITGLWQVEKRGDSGRLSADERRELDLFYAKRHSFKLDLYILVKTFTSFVQKERV